MTDDMDPRRYYDEFGEREWERLASNPANRMEFENTVAYLERDLPATGRVLDAGGGPGRYNCIGMRFAMQELKLLVPTVAQRISFELLSDPDPETIVGATLQPQDDVVARVSSE